MTSRNSSQVMNLCSVKTFLKSGQIRKSECLKCTFTASCCCARLSWAQDSLNWTLFFVCSIYSSDVENQQPMISDEAGQQLEAHVEPHSDTVAWRASSDRTTESTPPCTTPAPARQQHSLVVRDTPGGNKFRWAASLGLRKKKGKLCFI